MTTKAAMQKEIDRLRSENATLRGLIESQSMREMNRRVLERLAALISTEELVKVLCGELTQKTGEV